MSAFFNKSIFIAIQFYIISLNQKSKKQTNSKIPITDTINHTALVPSKPAKTSEVQKIYSNTEVTHFNNSSLDPSKITLTKLSSKSNETGQPSPKPAESESSSQPTLNPHVLPNDTINHPKIPCLYKIKTDDVAASSNSTGDCSDIDVQHAAQDGVVHVDYDLVANHDAEMDRAKVPQYLNGYQNRKYLQLRKYVNRNLPHYVLANLDQEKIDTQSQAETQFKNCELDIQIYFGSRDFDYLNRSAENAQSGKKNKPCLFGVVCKINNGKTDTIKPFTVIDSIESLYQYNDSIKFEKNLHPLNQNIKRHVDGSSNISANLSKNESFIFNIQFEFKDQNHENETLVINELIEMTYNQGDRQQIKEFEIEQKIKNLKKWNGKFVQHNKFLRDCDCKYIDASGTESDWESIHSDQSHSDYFDI